MTETTIYHVYAKQPGATKFRPVNITQNKIVTRLIKSTVILESYLNIAKGYIKNMKIKRPGLSFEIRKHSNSTVIFKQ